VLNYLKLNDVAMNSSNGSALCLLIRHCASCAIFLAFTAMAQDCELEKRMLENGLINIGATDSSIKVEIINATDNNMLGENTYGCLNKCYLHPKAAEKLMEAQKVLKKRHPGYSLKILEGARPRSIQKKMFDIVKNTSIRKFVADPLKGSMHNYGAAVDLTVIDSAGKELKMGDPDPRTKIVGKSKLELDMLFMINRISKKQKINRALLKSVMIEAGFFSLSYEWWHFDAFSKEYTRSNLKIVE
jgi:zinc D-Ala-D-Ala dipeptidase